MLTDLSNHLWQSTVFAAAAGLLTIAFRKNRAAVRYWLWFSTSLKFLIPFALLMSIVSGPGEIREVLEGVFGLRLVDLPELEEALGRLP